jgi:hypothetical protein
MTTYDQILSPAPLTEVELAGSYSSWIGSIGEPDGQGQAAQEAIGLRGQH